MFTSVIGSLTSLLPKYFIFGSYVPVLIFSFVKMLQANHRLVEGDITEARPPNRFLLRR